MMKNANVIDSRQEKNLIRKHKAQLRRAAELEQQREEEAEESKAAFSMNVGSHVYDDDDDDDFGGVSFGGLEDLYENVLKKLLKYTK